MIPLLLEEGYYLKLTKRRASSEYVLTKIKKIDRGSGHIHAENLREDGSVKEERISFSMATRIINEADSIVIDKERKPPRRDW